MRSQCRTFCWKKEISRESHNPNGDTYMIQFPDHMPAHCSNEVPGTCLGQVMRWAWIAIKPSTTVVEMAACMLGERS